MSNPNPQEEVKLTTEEARQGEATGHMRYVLGFSILGVVVIFGLLLSYYFNST